MIPVVRRLEEMLFAIEHPEHDRVFAQALLHVIHNQEAMMATLQDIEAAAQADLAKAQSEQNALTAISTLLQSQQAKIADLTTQLNAAIANGADPATLQAISDELTQTNTALDANAAAEAAMANTAPPAPAPSGTPAPGAGGTSNAPVTISSVSPATGLPGTQITITGRGFNAATIHGVKFGDVTDSLGVTVNSDTSISATIPAGLPTDSAIDVAVVTDGGDVFAGQFTVAAVAQAQAANPPNGQTAPAANPTTGSDIPAQQS